MPVWGCMRALLRRGWCRRALARRADGTPCHPNAADAAAWSIHGALLRAHNDLGLTRAELARARTQLRDRVWYRHRLLLMWCDDAPDFSARDAIALLDP